MNITILGASAGVGLLAVQKAIERNHNVTTLSRNTDALPEHKNLKKIKGNATNIPDLKKAIQGADAVVVTLGTGTSTKATTLYTDAAKAILQATKELDSNIPFIVLTGFGAGDSSKFQGFFMKIIFSLLLKDVYKNKTQMEEMIAASNLKWEFVRPGMLNDKPFSGKYRIETEYKKGMNIGAISRSDVADFLIKQAENPTLISKYPALSNK
ncbi:NAD(P)-dependent oxidoreductase [Epilithonimonas sp. UC225_85]|uniref:NAD(P)-dependent oxidoreductase n=1 Tax=Epilithonimonas sp. UC225_85 TaxID=3350167 RepID=UPI0036D31813